MSCGIPSIKVITQDFPGCNAVTFKTQMYFVKANYSACFPWSFLFIFLRILRNYTKNDNKLNDHDVIMPLY